jgi:methyl acetate hydrolase
LRSIEEDLMSELTATLDSVLDRVTTSTPRVPGVVAVVTDRERNVYEGAARRTRSRQW